MAKYVDSHELEQWWAGWLITDDNRNWQVLSDMLYKVCLGIAKKFRPKDNDEYHNLANEAITKVLIKIKRGKLKYKPTSEGGSPIFNLVTTTIQNILRTHKNSEKQKKINHTKYVRNIVQEQAPELLGSIDNFSTDHD